MTEQNPAAPGAPAARATNSTAKPTRRVQLGHHHAGDHTAPSAGGRGERAQFEAWARPIFQGAEAFDRIDGRPDAWEYNSNAVQAAWAAWQAALAAQPAHAPIQMVLHCPRCHLQHVDAPDERTPDWHNPPHRSHLCHGCGLIWRPADVPTIGVERTQTTGKNDTPFPQPSPAGLCISDDDRAVLQRLQDALPTVGINGWSKGVEVLERLLRQSLEQPSPAGQGDALVAEGLDYFERIGDAGDRKYVDSIRAALAARQPVGVSADTLRALADRWASDRGYTGSPADDIRALIDKSVAALQPVRQPTQALAAQPSQGGQGDARTQFEDFAKGKGFGISREHTGSERYFVSATQIAWDAWQAALAAQPSPAGQGDARELLAAEFDKNEVTSAAARRLRNHNETAVEAAALRVIAARQPVCGTCREAIRADGMTGTTCACARQPVGQPRGCESCGQTGIRQNDEGRNVFCPDCTLGNAYAGIAPPAQAVDLWQLNELCDLVTISNATGNERLFLDAVGNLQKAVRALIDSGKAVGNG